MFLCLLWIPNCLTVLWKCSHSLKNSVTSLDLFKAFSESMKLCTCNLLTHHPSQVYARYFAHLPLLSLASPGMPLPHCVLEYMTNICMSTACNSEWNLWSQGNGLFTSEYSLQMHMPVWQAHKHRPLSPTHNKDVHTLIPTHVSMLYLVIKRSQGFKEIKVAYHLSLRKLFADSSGITVGGKSAREETEENTKAIQCEKNSALLWAWKVKETVISPGWQAQDDRWITEPGKYKDTASSRASHKERSFAASWILLVRPVFAF